MTARDRVRATAPLDDPAVGGEPLVVDPAETGDRLDRHASGHATLVEDDRQSAGRPSTTRVVLPGPSGDFQAGGPGTKRLEILVDGWRVVVELEPASRAALRDRARRVAAEASRDGPLEVRAIIPGRVLSVAVAAGDSVAAGQQLLVVEAMKMQNELKAPRNGVVERVAVGAGETIELGDLLVVLS